MTSSLEKQFHKVQNQIWLGVLAVLICALLIPTPYRVRCNCELVSTSPRVAVAPFEGIVEKGFVRAGDIVKKGQLLGRMDGSRLRYELASINADLFRAQKEREVELARHNIPASLLAELDAKSLLSQKNLLEYEQQHIEIRSQIDGIVLNGSLEESEGASVGLGDVLFEVGPVDQLKLKVFIPAEEIASVGIGRPLRIWMDGFEHKRIVGHIQKIAPQSELKDAKNVFVAELTVDNSDLSFRPGMKGRVRIDCQHHRICWNLFHKPWNFLRSRLAWW